MKEKIIDLAHCNLTGIFDIEEYCNDNDINILNVDELLIDNNAITQITNLKKAKNLKSLVCIYNNITELKGLDNIINLKELITDESVKLC